MDTACRAVGCTQTELDDSIGNLNMEGSRVEKNTILIVKSIPL